MHTFMTQAQLAARHDLKEADQKLLEGIVLNLSFPDDSPDIMRAQAIRGYIVSLMDESIIDDSLRQDLEGDAAAFSDGWNAAFELSELAEKLTKSLRELGDLAEQLHSYRIPVVDHGQVIINGESYSVDEIKKAIRKLKEGEASDVG